MVRKLLAVFALALISANAWAQCSMCRAVTNSNMQSDDFVGTGLNPAIIYLMVLPYVLLTLIAVVFFRKQISSKLKALFN